MEGESLTEASLKGKLFLSRLTQPAPGSPSRERTKEIITLPSLSPSFQSPAGAACQQNPTSSRRTLELASIVSAVNLPLYRAGWRMMESGTQGS